MIAAHSPYLCLSPAAERKIYTVQLNPTPHHYSKSHLLQLAIWFLVPTATTPISYRDTSMSVTRIFRPTWVFFKL